MIFFKILIFLIFIVAQAAAGYSANSDSDTNRSGRNLYSKSNQEKSRKTLNNANSNGNNKKSQNPKNSSKSNNSSGQKNIEKTVTKSAKSNHKKSPKDKIDNSASKHQPSKTPDEDDSNQVDEDTAAQTQSPDDNSEETISKAKKSKFLSSRLWTKFSNDDIASLQQVNLALSQSNFDEAMMIAKNLKAKYANYDNSLADALIDIILWSKYSSKNLLKNSSKVSFKDISTFIIDSPYIPNLNDLRRNAERVAITNKVSFDEAQIYFNLNPALTTESKIYVVESKIMKIITDNKNSEEKNEKSKMLQSEIAKIWIKENFTYEEEKNYYEKYKDVITQSDHAQRMERLLWEGQRPEAGRLVNYLSEDYQKLFATILKIEEYPRYIDNLLLDLPRRLRSNELLNYRRMLWYKNKDQIDDLIDLLINIEDVKMPEKWWSYRRLYGREMIKRKKYKKAYQILAKHDLPETSPDFWEAEWTAGWVALRFLDEPKDALKHFQKMKRNVVQPVTLSRAIYWEGMSYEAMGQKAKAIESYKTAANYPIFFYGQLAIHKHRTLDPLGSQQDIILPKSPDISSRDLSKIAESRAAQIAYILAISGDRANASKIFEWIVNNAPTDGQIAVIMNIIAEIGDRQLDAKISRVASRRNVFFVKEKFQIIRDVIKDEYAPLVHAIIKQESGFAPTAVSRVGALGYMQLMPATAKLVAKELGIPYNQHKLTRDIKYNIRLGSHYIKKLINEFEGSEMMAIASYNAGPNATKRWVNEFYDPRKETNQDKIIDWIELITYSETRNYVQRIIENLIVYKYLMSRNNYDDVK